MATTTYNYSKDESLQKIAKLYNTDIKTLVRLNPWLLDSNDNHINIIPADTKTTVVYAGGFNSGKIDISIPMIPGSIIITVNYLNGESEVYLDDGKGKLRTDHPANVSRIKFKNIDYYSYYIEYNNGLEVKEINLVYTPVSKEDYLIVPLIANGNSSIEDYWNDINDSIGLHSDILIDNLLSTSSSKKTTYDMSTISAPYIDKYTMEYVDNELIDNYTDRNLAANSVDFIAAEVGQITQNIINAAALNINTYTTKNQSINALDIVGSKLGLGRLNSTRENTIGSKYSTNNKYSFIGNASYGKCKVIIGTTTLWMPCWPESVSDSVSAKYEEGTVVGRSEPYIVFGGTGSRSIKFTFDMHREMTGNEEEIEQIVKYIESAVYPNYDSAVAATRVRVEIGSQICISGVMNDRDVNWHGPIDENGKYKQVTVSFTVTESTGNPKSSNDIRKIGGFRD